MFCIVMSVCVYCAAAAVLSTEIERRQATQLWRHTTMFLCWMLLHRMDLFPSLLVNIYHLLINVNITY